MRMKGKGGMRWTSGRTPQTGTLETPTLDTQRPSKPCYPSIVVDPRHCVDPRVPARPLREGARQHSSARVLEAPRGVGAADTRAGPLGPRGTIMEVLGLLVRTPPPIPGCLKHRFSEK